MNKVVGLCVAVFLGASFAVPADALLAERASSGKPADFAAYLKDSTLPAIYLVELERQCLEEGNLAACRRAADILDDAGRFGEAIGLADSVEVRRASPEPGAKLIKARSLFSAEHYRRAIGVLDTVVAAFPSGGTMVEATGLRAVCQLSLGLADPALVNLRALESRVGPDLRPTYIVWRARAEEQAGTLSKAAGLYGEAWDHGSVEAALGLVRCALRDGRPDACPALLKDVAKRGLVLPRPGACELASMFDDVNPDVWRALVKSMIADTAFDAGACPEIVASIVRRAEAGDDVAAYCETLIGRTASSSVKQNLRYARAVSLKDPVRSLDSLAYLLGQASDAGLKTRCLGAALALDPQRREMLVRDLGSGVRALYGQLSPDERLALSRVLVGCGVREPAVADLRALLEGLKAGYDDRAMTEIGILLEKAGDRDKALTVYDQVAGSPLQSEASLECEKRAYLLRIPTQPTVDISKEIEKIAKKGASDLELGDLFMDKLKDYERAAAYYRTAAASAEGSDADRLRLKLVQALALANVAAPDDLRRAEALSLLAALAAAKAVKPEDVLGATKVATDWLRLDKIRVVEISSVLAQRKDLAPSTLYGLAIVLCHLFEQDDLTVYAQCLTILNRLSTDASSAKQAPFAGLVLGRIRFLAGDYAGARDAFEAYAEKSRDALATSVANVGLGECYLASGGASRALEYFKQGRSTGVNFQTGWCFEILGQPDSSEAYYRAALSSLAPEDLADRARVRLGLVLAAKQDFGKALATVSSPLPEVRARLRSARLVVAACALCARGYDKLGVQALAGIGSGESPVATQALLTAASCLGEAEPAAAHEMLQAAKPDSDYVLEEYAVLAARGRYGCSSPRPELCTEARQEVLKSFPLDQDLVTELGIRRVLAMLETASGAQADSMMDNLLASGAKHPMMAEIMYRKGITLLVKGDYPGAEKVFLELADTYPSSPFYRDACFKMGSAYYMMEKYGPSARYFGLAALSEKPSLVRDALFNLSLALEQTGQFREAAGACRQLAVEFPFSDQFERALVRTGYCLQNAGNPVAAIGFYEAALKYTGRTETMAETMYWIAESYAQMGDHLRAACEFLRTAYLYPKEGQWAGTASFTAGDECEKAGLTDHAIAIYRQNVRKYGKASEWGNASDERLTELKAASTPSDGQVPGGK